MSEDWEKDFDLDMTEEEVQMALSKVGSSGEVRGFRNARLSAREPARDEVNRGLLSASLQLEEDWENWD